MDGGVVMDYAAGAALPPPAGTLTTDNPDVSLAAKLYPHKSEKTNGYDVSHVWLGAAVGSSWLIQDAYDSTRFATFEQLAPGVDLGTYVEIAVAFKSASVPPLGNVILTFIDEPAAVVPPPGTGRPSVEEVALLIRARTKDSSGHEVGTFDDDTRPTGDDVELQIDAAYALVLTRLPPLETLHESIVPAVQSLVAYRAALRIEKSYFPEQVRSDRSAYDQLYQEYTDDLVALTDAIAAGGGGELPGDTADVASLPVASWTSLP